MVSVCVNGYADASGKKMQSCWEVESEIINTHDS